MNMYFPNLKKMPNLKKIPKTYGHINLIMGGLIMFVLGLVFSVLLSLVFVPLGLLVPALSGLLAILTIVIGFWASGLIAVFVVRGWMKKNKRYGGY